MCCPSSVLQPSWYICICLLKSWFNSYYHVKYSNVIEIYTVPSHVQISKSMFWGSVDLNGSLSCYSALFESVPAAPADDVLSVSSDDTESESGARSPCSPGIGGPTLNPLEPSLWSQYTLAPCASLLGKMQLVFCTADWCMHKLCQINRMQLENWQKMLV